MKNLIGTIILATTVFLSSSVARTWAQEGANPDERIGVLLAAGDIAGCFQADRKYKEVAALIQAEIDKAPNLPLAVLVLGDVAYSNRTNGNLASPSYADCFEDFAATWGVHYDRLLPIPGNHDYSDDPSENVFHAYFEKTLTELDADKDAYFYSTIFPKGHDAGWLLAAINFYSDRSRQEEWLDLTLSGSKAECALIFTHPFLNSSGDHGRDHSEWTYARMQPFMNIATERGATLLVTAHDHDYERFARQDAAGEESADGVGSFVVGTGGAHLYSVPDNERHRLSRAFENKHAGLLKLELYPDRYVSSFITTDGLVLDASSGAQECAKRLPQ